MTHTSCVCLLTQHTVLNMSCSSTFINPLLNLNDNKCYTMNAWAQRNAPQRHVIILHRIPPHHLSVTLRTLRPPKQASACSHHNPRMYSRRRLKLHQLSQASPAAEKVLCSLATAFSLIDLDCHALQHDHNLLLGQHFTSNRAGQAWGGGGPAQVLRIII